MKHPFGTRPATGFDLSAQPQDGWFGGYGGQFVPELLAGTLDAVTRAAESCFADRGYQLELETELASWAGRPTPLTQAPGLSAAWGAKILLKREDLTHTGAHKINNAVGQVGIARRMNVSRIIAETGAGQHGVATAAACARAGVPCRVYMGEVDVKRQAPNVHRMELFGAEVVSVSSGDRTLRAAINEAIRDWASDPNGTYYLIGSAVGPHPYPWIVRTIQSVIGTETRNQLQLLDLHPDIVVACVGGGSNAIGMFHPFLQDAGVRLVGVEAAGTGIAEGRHAATIAAGRAGVLHGSYSLLLQDDDGQISETHSISAGLDYPGVGPEHAMLREIGRVSYDSATDEQALKALDECCRIEGILPALESAHALAGARAAARANPGATIVVCLSGRGDKDIETLVNR